MGQRIHFIESRLGRNRFGRPGKASRAPQWCKQQMVSVVFAGSEEQAARPTAAIKRKDFRRFLFTVHAPGELLVISFTLNILCQLRVRSQPDNHLDKIINKEVLIEFRIIADDAMRVRELQDYVLDSDNRAPGR